MIEKNIDITQPIRLSTRDLLAVSLSIAVPEVLSPGAMFIWLSKGAQKRRKPGVKRFNFGACAVFVHYERERLQKLPPPFSICSLT